MLNFAVQGDGGKTRILVLFIALQCSPWQVKHCKASKPQRAFCYNINNWLCRSCPGKYITPYVEDVCFWGQIISVFGWQVSEEGEQKSFKVAQGFWPLPLSVIKAPVIKEAGMLFKSLTDLNTRLVVFPVNHIYTFSVCEC